MDLRQSIERQKLRTIFIPMDLVLPVARALEEAQLCKPCKVSVLVCINDEASLFKIQKAVGVNEAEEIIYEDVAEFHVQDCTCGGNVWKLWCVGIWYYCNGIGVLRRKVKEFFSEILREGDIHEYMEFREEWTQEELEEYRSKELKEMIGDDMYLLHLDRLEGMLEEMEVFSLA